MQVRELDKNHDWTLGHLNASEAIAQNVKTAVLSLRNDWFLDLEYGVKCFDYLAKNPNLQAMESDIKNMVLNVEGVASLNKFSINLNGRVAKIEISYTDIYGQNSEVSVNANN